MLGAIVWNPAGIGLMLMKTLPLHAVIVADQFHLIPLRIDHIKRAPMHPCVFGGFDLESQRFESLLFVSEISRGYFEGDVVNGGSCCVRPTIAGLRPPGRGGAAERLAQSTLGRWVT